MGEYTEKTKLFSWIMPSFLWNIINTCQYHANVNVYYISSDQNFLFEENMIPCGQQSACGENYSCMLIDFLVPCH